MSDESFPALIRRVRAGDEQAATEVVRIYEPEIRREVRLRLTDPGLRRVLDSVDICQSVLGSFFVRAASGQYELEQPGQLLRLLVRIAHNKVVDETRRARSARRNPRRLSRLPADHATRWKSISPAPSPSEEVSLNELQEEFRKLLTPQERRLADLRAGGRTWAEIATRMSGTPEALRKRLARAVDRICLALGLN